MAFMAMRSLHPYSRATRFSILGAARGDFHITRTLSGENLKAPAVEAKDSSLAAEKRKKRAIVVNSKWGERSVDPLYSHLLYSSEVRSSEKSYGSSVTLYPRLRLSTL